MKPSIVLLIIGGGLLVAGLVIGGISTFGATMQVLKGATVINNTQLEPNLSFVAVSKNLPAGQQLLLSLSSKPNDVPLQARITEQDGSVLVTFEIKQTPFTSSLKTNKSGDHTLEIKNVGSRSVTINGALLNSPVAQQAGGVAVKDSASLQDLVTYGIGILVGLVLIIAGIILLIIGAVKYFGGRKSAPSSSDMIH